MVVAAGSGASWARRVPEVQRIWIHCDEKDEVRDIMAFCSGSWRPLLSPKLVEVEAGASSSLHALDFLRLRLRTPPLVYQEDDWEQLWADMEVLLAASRASWSGNQLMLKLTDSKKLTDTKKRHRSDKENYRQLQAMRWPSLLVTDREKLCEVRADANFMAALAEATGCRAEDLLPVVLAADFRLLSGRLVVDSPLDVFTSLIPDSSSLKQHDSEKPSEVSLPLGVFLQRYRAAREGFNDGSSLPAFGARCLALFADGQCAYSAVSEDGVRIVEASGRWSVINGHVVVGASDGQASVAHMALSNMQVYPLDHVYGEPIHIPLQELVSVFEPPIDLADCVARPGTGDHLRLLIREQMATSEEPVTGAVEVTPMENLSATFSKTWRLSQEDASPFKPLETCDDPSSMHTSQHALIKVARTLSNTKLIADSSTPSSRSRSRPPSSGAPRLLGLQRGITTTLPEGTSVAESLPQPAAHGKPEPFFAALQKLSEFAAASSQGNSGAMQTFLTCSLRPGMYFFESTQEGTSSHRSTEMTLHANGSCKYREDGQRDIMRSKGAPTWRVEDGTLVLEAHPENSENGFLLRETRGIRVQERQVKRVELSVSMVLQQYRYTPFPQQLHPFPMHAPKDESQRIFGVIDPVSPVLHGMRCRPDRIPYHAFEHELRQHGIACDDLLSDFRFIDRDEDGQLSLADMRLIESYGEAAIATEVIDEFREALLYRYEDLSQAFSAFTGGDTEGTITLEDFERFMIKVGQEPPDKQERQRAELQDWVGKTSPEDRAAIFASINPQNNPSIDMIDFMSLNLHTAVLAMRRLEHFQGWIFEQFGKTKDVFDRVFDALCVEPMVSEFEKSLTRKAFAVGASAIGYPCRTRATKSMFSMLDRNLDGKVTKAEFQWLRTFDAQQLLVSLDSLKRLVEKKLGGIDECFQKLRRREQSVQNSQYLPFSVSFEAFRKVLGPGLAKLVRDPDLKALFLFLDEACKKHANGYITLVEWSLLRGLDSRALTGSPARLRRILEERYGGIDQAFQEMHTSWLKRALIKGLSETAIAGLARALFSVDDVDDRNQKRTNLLFKARWANSYASKAGKYYRRLGGRSCGPLRPVTHDGSLRHSASAGRLADGGRHHMDGRQFQELPSTRLLGRLSRPASAVALHPGS